MSLSLAQKTLCRSKLLYSYCVFLYRKKLKSMSARDRVGKDVLVNNRKKYWNQVGCRYTRMSYFFLCLVLPSWLL